MSRRRPFLQDGSRLGVSRTEFRRMRKAQKLELMIGWFHQNYEDPAERTPYETAEGGYQWIWGGPHEAGDVLYDKFSGIAPEGLIEDAIKNVEAGGLFEWAPKPRYSDYDESEPPEDPISFEIFSDEPSADYGTPAERRARGQAKTAIQKLQAALDSQRPIGMGHNNGPLRDELEASGEEAGEIEELRKALPQLSSELAKPYPAIALVKQWAQPLRKAVIATATWIGRKLDKAVDAGMTTFGKTVGAAFGLELTHCGPFLQQAFDAVVKWLEIAAKTLL